MPPPFSDAEIRAAVDALPDPIVVLRSIRDESGGVVDFRISWANSALVSVTGIRQEQRSGQLLSDYLGHVREDVLEQLIDVVTSGRPVRLDRILQRGTVAGQESSMSAEISASKFGDGLVVLLYGMRPEGAHSESEAAREG